MKHVHFLHLRDILLGVIFGLMLAFVILLTGCGTFNGEKIYETRQGVQVFAQGTPNTENLEQLDSLIDEMLSSWASRFGTNGFYNIDQGQLASLKLTLVSAYIPATDGSNKAWNGYQQAHVIKIVRNDPCWGKVPLVHEFAHWILWRTTGNSQGNHPEGVVWGFRDGSWVWDESLYISRRAGGLCPGIWKEAEE